jgi:hypothetical protein
MTIEKLTVHLGIQGARTSHGDDTSLTVGTPTRRRNACYQTLGASDEGAIVLFAEKRTDIRGAVQGEDRAG